MCHNGWAKIKPPKVCGWYNCIGQLARIMINTLKDSSENAGLKTNFGKTTIITNLAMSNNINIDCNEYLGYDNHTQEIPRRITTKLDHYLENLEKWAIYQGVFKRKCTISVFCRCKHMVWAETSNTHKWQIKLDTHARWDVHDWGYASEIE